MKQKISPATAVIIVTIVLIIVVAVGWKFTLGKSAPAGDEQPIDDAAMMEMEAQGGAMESVAGDVSTDAPPAEEGMQGTMTAP